MKILAIDTSSQNASVAILEDTISLVEINNSEEKTHSQKIMCMIDEAFHQCNLTLANIELIACCLGPGSFTGVRIGISTAKAFSDVYHLPVVGVSSLEELASAVNENTLIVSILDAKHDNVYYQFFKKHNSNIQAICEPTFDSIQNCLEHLNKITNTYTICNFVGDGSSIYQYTILSSITKKLEIKFPNEIIASSIRVGKVGYTKYQNGQFGNVSILSPIYLRKSQAEIALEEKGK